MSELPEGWATANLANLGEPGQQTVLTGPFGANLGKEDFIARGVPVFTIGCLAADAIKRTKLLYVSPTKAHELSAYQLREGDFLFSRMASVGRVGFVPSDLKGALFNYHLMRLRLDDELVLPRFFYFFVRGAEQVETYLDEVSRGATRDGINTKLLLNMPVSVPPVPEQRRIVAKIDSLTGKSRRARDHLDHTPRLVEKYKQAVLAAAFRGDLTRRWRAERGIAALYQTVFIADVVTDIHYGTAKKCGYDAGATPVLRIPNVQKGEIALNDMKSADFEEAELRKLRLRQGDLLLIRSNGSLGLVGRCAVVNEAAAGMLFAGYLIRLRLNTEAVLPRYAHLWLQSASMRSIIEGLAKSTSGVNNINSTQIQQLPIKLTGLDEQSEIVRRIDVAFQWIDRLASGATSSRRLIDRLDQAVLAKAFRGELVLQDPQDEPASVLLERMSPERATAPKSKRGRKAQAEA